ncbi:MAG: hypothetical protein SYC29_12125 [Planctomycetota bacterium]|nr:hypothetical protein [Planctomycetota bacterium]
MARLAAQPGTLLPGLLASALLALAGCQSAPRNMPAVRSYYNYDFTSAREALRGDAYLRNDEQTLLDNLRLGMAALADGDLREAERALGRSFELLSTAGLNADRTTAAVFIHEGVRIWKGEPFEQALAYHYVSALYAVMGDWENARAAAANALFRLTDFGADQTPEKLVRNAAKDDDYLDEGYTAVDTDFALGFLMQALASDLSGAAGAGRQYDAALEINGDLEPLVQTLRARDFDTLLIVDYGKGPTKIAYGRDSALVRFVEQDTHRGPLVVSIDGREAIRARPVCDVNRMARDHRWNNLEDVRRAKSLIGDALLVTGSIVASHGDRDNRLIGAGMMLAGLLSKSGAKADTRYLEFAPQLIYLVPVRLETAGDLRVMGAGDEGSRMLLPDVEPGTADNPRAIYLRLHGVDSPDPAWLTADTLIYGNDHAGVRPGDYPWILGGRDVSTPSRRALEAYQAGGHLADLTVADLRDLYRAEAIVLGSGMEGRPGVKRNPSYRHILEGGTGLFTPRPYSMGYKRVMFSPHGRYDPDSELARNAALRIRVQQDDPEQEELR